MRFQTFFTYAVVLLLAIPVEASFTRDLYVGLRNDPDVVRLQEFLRGEGFFTYPESTGNFFASTQNAVSAFQRAHDIAPDFGYFGPLTRNIANEILADAPLPAVPASDNAFGRDLFTGLRNDADVIRLQEILRSLKFFTYPESTGNYFAVTENAVRMYQQSRAITPLTGNFQGITRYIMNQEIDAGIIRTDGESTQISPPPQTATSTFYDVITISRFSGKDDKPLKESITLTNRSRDKTVDITDWVLESSRGTRIVIPLVYNLPGTAEFSLQNRLLVPPRGTVVITVGKQDRHINFRENICTGYFDEHTKFTPSISNRCPRPDTENLTYFDDKCIKAISRVGRCETPTQDDLLWQSAECTSYMVDNFSYAGCVRNYRAQEDFFLNKWYIWLQRDTELFRNTHDTITLTDSTGKFVDSRSY